MACKSSSEAWSTPCVARLSRTVWPSATPVCRRSAASEFRVGVHLGDVVEESDGDLMGDGVNIAARLEGIAKPGAICLSEQAYWQVKSRLDLAVSDLGAIQLKNIAEPVRVYSLQVGVPAQAKSAAPEPAQGTATPPFYRRSALCQSGRRSRAGLFR
jgi:class 3 adenylate cyclase